MVGGLCAFCIADPSRSGLSLSVQTERIPAKSRTVPALDGAAPEEGEIRSQLQRILRSRDFVASLRNRRFLEHVVENTLRGRRVKGHEIGTKIFGRGTEFNATTDPIVRIEAGKLRRDLEMYYLKGGRVDGVHIVLAKGAYRAVFSYRQPPNDEASAPTRGSLIILRAALLGLAGDRREATALWSDAEDEFPGFPLDSESHRALEELHGGLEPVRDLLLDGLRRALAIRDAGAPQEPFAESAPAHCS